MKVCFDLLIRFIFWMLLERWKPFLIRFLFARWRRNSGELRPQGFKAYFAKDSISFKCVFFILAGGKGARGSLPFPRSSYRRYQIVWNNMEQYKEVYWFCMKINHIILPWYKRVPYKNLRKMNFSQALSKTCPLPRYTKAPKGREPQIWCFRAMKMN